MSPAHDHAILARACVTRAVRELQEAIARCAQGNDLDPDIVLPETSVRHVARSAEAVLESLEAVIARHT